MDGLKNFFLKLTPIMLLICCICYGILHTFQTANSNNITYLTQESINIGTEEQPEYKTLYKFDMVSYTQNIDQDILKRSVTKTFDINAYERTLEKFNEIWQDGYQLFDVSKTIANGIVLTINTIILPINIVLVPIRVIAGILLTGMSLIGININNGSILCPFLTFLVDKLAIPLISPDNEQETQPNNILFNTTWALEPNIDELYTEDIEINFEFTAQQENGNITQFTGIKISKQPNNKIVVDYKLEGGLLQRVYWGDSNWEDGTILRIITIGTNRNLTQQETNQLSTFLQTYCVRIQ